MDAFAVGDDGEAVFGWSVRFVAVEAEVALFEDEFAVFCGETRVELESFDSLLCTVFYFLVA